MTRIEITLAEGMTAKLDEARGLVPRATYIKHVLDGHLGASEVLGKALDQINQTPPEKLGMSRSEARKQAVQRGSGSPSLERFK